MKKKLFALLILGCVVLPALFLGIYQFGVNSNFRAVSSSIETYQQGWNDGVNSTVIQQQITSNFSYSQGYKAGYQAGLKAPQNNTLP